VEVTNMRTSRSLFSVLAVGVVAVSALTACGTGGSEQSAVTVKTASEVLTATAAATESAGTFRTSGTMTINDTAGSGLGGAIPLEGFTDKKNKAASFSMDMTTLMKGAVAAAGDDDPDSAEMMESMFGGDFKFEVITIDTTAYMKMGALGAMAGAPAGKWLKIDAAALGITESELAGLGGGASADLGLTYLKSVNAAGVTEVGKEKVRDVETTHYSAKAGVDALVKNSTKAQQEKTRKQMADAGITEVPIDVWVDADGVTRRLKFTMQGSGAGAGAFGGEIVALMEFYDFGAKVTVAAPPAADVVSIDEVPALKEALAQQGAAGGSGSTVATAA
jgi:hypothetical protein